MRLSNIENTDIARIRTEKSDILLQALVSYSPKFSNSNKVLTIRQYAALYHIVLKLYYLRFIEGIDKDVDNLSLLLSDLPTSTGEFSFYVIDKDACLKMESTLFDSQVYLFNFLNFNQNENKLYWINQAIDLGIRLGFRNLIRDNLGIVIILSDKSSYEASNSYTISVLPGTIFIDFYDDIYKLCEMLVHECSHIYLNDLFALHGETFDSSIRYWSNWKQCERPIVGILHAAYTFSNVIIYYRKLLECQSLHNETREYISKQLDLETHKLFKSLPEIKLAGLHLKKTQSRYVFFEKIELALQKGSIFNFG